MFNLTDGVTIGPMPVPHSAKVEIAEPLTPPAVTVVVGEQVVTKGPNSDLAMTLFEMYVETA